MVQCVAPGAAVRPSPAAAVAVPQSPPATFVGPARVVDGDTLYIGQDKFRLYGVDAPEKAQSCVDARGRNYACGLVSKDALAQKVGSQTVSCARKAKDQYGREVAVCSLLPALPGLGQPEDLNKWLVDNGLAVAYREYGKDYIPAEEAAKAAHKGIWAGTFQYPAQWRKDQKSGANNQPPLAPIAPLPPAPPLPGALAAAVSSPAQVIAAALPTAATTTTTTTTIAAASSAPAPSCGPSGTLPIKGNINSKGDRIYHLPGGPYYDKVLVEPEKGEQYFCSEADAKAKGYRPVAAAAAK